MLYGAAGAGHRPPAVVNAIPGAYDP